MGGGRVVALSAEDAQDREAAAILEQVHNQAIRAPIKEAAESLQRLLTGRVTAYVVGVKDVKTITRWATGEVTDIRVESEQRLRTAYEIMTLLLRFDGPTTVRAWFIGSNPHLADDAPADAIHEGRLQDAMGAARSFVAYGANYG
jgi:hypothetical protein